MDLPTVIHVAEPRTRSRVCLDLSIAEGLDVCDGHFPGMPVVPGVVLIHWALQLCQQFLRPLSPLAIGHIEALKFQQVLTPPAEFQLELQCSATLLQFTYSSATGRHSSGKIALLP